MLPHRRPLLCISLLLLAPLLQLCRGVLHVAEHVVDAIQGPRLRVRYLGSPRRQHLLQALRQLRLPFPVLPQFLSNCFFSAHSSCKICCGMNWSRPSLAVAGVAGAAEGSSQCNRGSVVFGAGLVGRGTLQ
ncbi:MAG TPA: hypothetical protein VGN70_11630 [Gammaproteobacteria bacterium]|jgi:hypothetical protein